MPVKRSFLLMLTLGLFLGLSLNSCDNKDDKDVGTCSDGILNQGEEDVDFGGPCPPCVYNPSMTAKVSGYNWIAANMTATLSGGQLIITADNGVTRFWMLILVHNGAQKAGTYDLAADTKILNMNSKEFHYVSGTITFSEFNTTTKRISGSFSFKVKATGETLVIDIDNGKFTHLTY